MVGGRHDLNARGKMKAEDVNTDTRYFQHLQDFPKSGWHSVRDIEGDVNLRPMWSTFLSDLADRGLVERRKGQSGPNEYRISPEGRKALAMNGDIDPDEANDIEDLNRLKDETEKATEALMQATENDELKARCTEVEECIEELREFVESR